MINDSESKPETDYVLLAIFVAVVFVVLPIFVGLHFIWSELHWLRAIACGLVMIPAVLILDFLRINMTSGKESMNLGCAVLLPVPVGLLSISFGWNATLWGIVALTLLIAVHVANYWIQTKRDNSQSGESP